MSIMVKNKFSNRAYNFIRRYYLAILSRFNTVCMYIQANICGVQLGRGCVFRGRASFHVSNGGAMIIGRDNTFLSKESVNNIGINHRCILSVTPIEGRTCTLQIGDKCGFSGTAIWCFDSITIGNNVRCGANTLIMDGDAHFDDPRTSPPKSIIIKDNVFLGANVVVKKGVTIGENSVVGMNSVVTKDIPANCVAVGNPCRIIKQL